MGRLTVKNFCAFQQGLGESRVRVDDTGQIPGFQPHLNGQKAFADEFSGSNAANADAQDLLRRGIDKKFRHAVGPFKRERTAVQAESRR